MMEKFPANFYLIGKIIMMGKINVKTLGCRLNTYESEALRIMSESEGLGDTTIINSCAVTSEAVKKAKKT